MMALMSRTQYKLLFLMKSASGVVSAPTFDVWLQLVRGNQRTVDALVFNGWLLFYPHGAKGKGSYRLSGEGDLAFSDQYAKWGDPE